VSADAPPPERRRGDLRLVRRLLAEARPLRGPLVVLLLVQVLATPLALLAPVPLQLAVDQVLGGRPLPRWLAAVLPSSWHSPDALLWVAAVATVLVALLLQAQQLAAWYLRASIGERLVLGWRARLFGHLQRLSLAFHDAGGTAQSVHRVQSDAASIDTVVVQGILRLSTTLLQVVVLVAVTAQIDATLVLIALAGAPVMLLLTRIYRNRLRKGWREVHEHAANAMAVVQESLGAVRVVKAFGQEERERQRYLARARQGQEAMLRAVTAHGGFDLLVGLTVGLVGAAVLFVGASRVRDGVLTLGELLLVVGYLTQLFGPLREIGTKTADLQRALAGAERCFALLDERPEAEERPGARPLPRARGEVEFRNVSFAYDPARPVLTDVSLHVPAGSRVGIAGRSGSGKSTLLGLLFRFHDPTSGTVLLDGMDVRDLRLSDLRSQFALVLQDPVLFSTTIAENIAYGRPDAGPAEIEAAARAAGAHDFIVKAVRGYDTEVGERGAMLSGGERQRISLARAFLKDAPILILDEPTSSVDMATEQSIMDALERLMQGRTTFLIAHRLSTLAACDVRVEVVDGRVVRRDDLVRPAR
jgi:ATP-binding cassette, subfamily B, bacterial